MNITTVPFRDEEIIVGISYKNKSHFLDTAKKTAHEARLSSQHLATSRDAREHRRILILLGLYLFDDYIYISISQPPPARLMIAGLLH
jgi:type II secretory pathway component PulM